ncbi:MAG: aminopeptidase P family protein [Alphaproteobacteria bacterium]|nr:aminopeptidase P family protein [Alphaproteobacteria bacterium]MBV9903374.1 aminopeptidase P family protein [Alphaproteobacteria bacterium]
MPNETERRAGLEAAEAKGMALFDMVEAEQILRPGRSELEVDHDIYDLARAKFGVLRHWHKRIVRAGPNTICVYADSPPDRVIGDNDTVYLDFGPVFGEWQADIGRSYALGDDPEKKRLVADLPRIFDVVQAHYRATSDITGEQLYRFAQRQAFEAGWLFGGSIAGHIILGEYSMPRPTGDAGRNYIAPGNRERMRLPDTLGRARHWILEIHLTDRDKTYGGFYERLL